MASNQTPEPDDLGKFLRFPRLMLRAWAIVELISTVVLVLALALILLVFPHPLDITREQYGSALAKWQSNSIAEYEETVYSAASGLANDFRGGEWKLHVHVVQGKEEIADVQRHYLGGLIPHEGDDLGFAEQLTVGALFKDIERGFDIDVLGRIDEDGYYQYTKVEFDPKLGYPTTITQRMRFVLSECTECQYQQIIVQSLKVLK